MWIYFRSDEHFFSVVSFLLKLATIKLDKINKAVDGLSSAIRTTSVLASNIGKKVRESNQRLKERISNANKNFQRRLEGSRKKQREQKLREDEEAQQKDLEAQKIREWEEKFDEEQKIKLREELIREEKIEQREKLRRAIKEQEDKTLQEELFNKLDAFEINETKKN